MKTNTLQNEYPKDIYGLWGFMPKERETKEDTRLSDCVS